MIVPLLMEQAAGRREPACHRRPRRGGRMGPVWLSAVKKLPVLFGGVLQHSSKQPKCLLEISLFTLWLYCRLSMGEMGEI